MTDDPSGGPSAPRRLLWLTKGLGRGGTERLLVDAARLVDRTRFDIEVAYLMNGNDDLVHELHAANVPVCCLGQSSSHDLRWVRRLLSLTTHGGYDLVHTHAPLPAVAARLVGGRQRPRIVHTEHNLWSSYRRPTRVANAWTYHRNDRVIAVSQAVADSIDARRLRRGARVEVLRHGIVTRDVVVPQADRSHARAVLGLPVGPPVIGTVASLSAKKDQSTLLRAFRATLTRVPDARLVVIGDGALESELKAEAESLGLNGSALFTGARPDVDALLPAFDLFTLTSRYEGLPISLLEAMRAGLPSVVTPVGGVGEVVTHGKEGLLVAVGRPDEIADAFVHVLQSAEVRESMGGAALARSRDFDLQSTVTRLEDLYDDVLAV